MRAQKVLRKSLSNMVGIIILAIIAFTTIQKAEASIEFRYTGNWNDTNSWLSGIIPTSSDLIFMQRAGTTAIVDQAGCVCSETYFGNIIEDYIDIRPGGSLSMGRVHLGYGTDTKAHIVQSGGSFSAGEFRMGRSSGSSAIFDQSGGTSTISSVLGGYSAGSYSEYNISDGELTTPNTLYCGYNGTGVVNQSGGTVTAPSVYMGVTAGTSYGEYNLSGGILTAGLRVGRDASARFVQAGGTNYLKALSSFSLVVGTDDGGISSYTLQSGTLILTNSALQYAAIGPGNNDKGIFYFGTNSSANGVFKESANAQCRLRLAYGTNVLGEIHGFGAVELTGIFYMSGRIVADGYGVDKTLDFSTLYRKIYNVYDNPLDGTNGYFAINHGKVLLPAETSLATTMIWGERTYDGTDTTLDLINSAMLVVGGSVSIDGGFTGALLAPERAEVPSVDFFDHVAAIWEFSGINMGSTGYATLTFRYDHSAVAESDKYESESDLGVYHYDGAEWVDITDGIDTTNKWITTTSVSSLGFFATGHKKLPPQGSVVTIR